MSLFNNNLRLGYACINTSVDYTCNRGVKMNTITKLGHDDGIKYIKSLVKQNLKDLLDILKWNQANGIKVFRITSELFPQIGNITFRDSFPKSSYFKGNISFASKLLKEIGEYATKHGMRLTFHSSPYMQLATPNNPVWLNTLFDLSIYSKLQKLMNLKTPCLIMHGGGIYGDKISTTKKWIERYNNLPTDIKKLIMLENDEYLYDINDVMAMNQICNVPICFDMFHNLASLIPAPLTANLLDKVARTWANSDITIPKMHWSEQKPGERRGAHSDYVTYLLPEFIDWAKKNKVDLMLECKMKERSVFKLLEKYSK